MKKLLLFNILSNNLTDYSTQLNCHVQFLLKFFNKIRNKSYFLKIMNLYSLVIVIHLKSCISEAPAVKFGNFKVLKFENLSLQDVCLLFQLYVFLSDSP